MSIDSDMEIIKSAIIYGDIGDAEKVIQRRIKNLGIILKRRSRPELQEYLEFLNALDSLLRSRITLEQFKSISGGIHGLENLLERHTGEHGYLPSLFYLLELSILTMTYGNVAALSQNNLKRLLAYSSIAQAGYLILVLAVVGFVGNTNSAVVDVAVAAGMFYALVYVFMKGGAFITLNLIKKDNVMISDVSGLAKKSPATAVSFAVMLLALAGVPITGGFFAKYLLFLSLIEGNLWWLAIIAILNSAISVFYYFRIILYMFGKDPIPGESFDMSTSTRVPIYASAFITVALSVVVIWWPSLISMANGLFG